MSICVFPGKFQPFHNGHMMVVKGMVKMCDRLVIVICCGKQGEDIFSAEEVREMVSSALLDEDILDAEIHVLNDCPTNDEWVDRLKEVGEGQDIQVWSGREDILAACDKSGIRTKKIVHVPGHDSDDIRALITGKKDGWESKVPHSVASVIRSKAR